MRKDCFTYEQCYIPLSNYVILCYITIKHDNASTLRYIEWHNTGIGGLLWMQTLPQDGIPENHSSIIYNLGPYHYACDMILNDHWSLSAMCYRKTWLNNDTEANCNVLFQLVGTSIGKLDDSVKSIYILSTS